MSKTRLFLSYHLPLILWLIVIFFLSSIPQLKSPLPDLYDLILRKLAHITEYFILAYLIYRPIREYHKVGENSSMALTILVPFLYAISDEYHQTFVFGRHGSSRDVAIDFIGILILVIIIKFTKIKSA